ncbi:MAG TPA: ATP-binding protein, partial [Acidobacteriota bacterium]|nr:ATP-binding protein [Acidobacteriota bacterium]
VTSALERDDQGEPQRVVSHISDQTLRQKLWSEVSRIHDELETQVARRTAELQASEASLRHREEHIRAIIENLPVVVYDRMPDGRVSYISPNLTSLWGYRPEEFQEDPDFWTSRIHPEDRATFRVRPDFSASQEYRFFSRRKNDYVWVQDVTRAEHEAGGRVQRYIGIMADITNQRELQEQVFHSQKMETLGALAAGFAHDFINQLTGVMSNVELIAKKSGPDSPYEAEIRDALVAARICSELVRSMITFGRGLQGALTVCQPNQIVEECVGLLRHSLSREIQIKLITNPDVWTVRADETQILQVLMNLALNARDAMPEGGTLMIETNNHTIDAEYCSRMMDARPGRYVVISVGDTGSGIDQEVLPRIFEPFFSTKETGRNFGMGLVSASGIVKAHRGWIEVLTQPGEGSNFRVFLPRIEEGSAHADQLEPSGRQMVLVVDDAESIRRMSRKVLEEAGFHVLLAEDVTEALRLLDHFGKRIRGVVLDFSSSARTARELFEEIHHEDANMHVLLTAGYSSADTAALTARGASLLPKPFTATELVDAVKKMLG